MTHRRIAAACLVLAVALTVFLFTPPAAAHGGHKVGPVCTAKQAKAHPKKCIVILAPKGTRPDVVITVPAVPPVKA